MTDDLVERVARAWRDAADVGNPYTSAEAALAVARGIHGVQRRRGKGLDAPTAPAAGGIMTDIRMWLTRCLIRLAMRTCVMGFCHDHLQEALKRERKW